MWRLIAGHGSESVGHRMRGGVPATGGTRVPYILTGCQLACAITSRYQARLVAGRIRNMGAMHGSDPKTGLDTVETRTSESWLL